MPSKRKVASKCRTCWVVILFLASVAAIITVAVIQDHWRVKEYSFEYGIVVDSGSSRSTIYLYLWPGEKQNETGIVTEVKSCRVTGDGISEMKVDPVKDAATWNGFDQCLSQIKALIPVEKHKKTPLFLGATAGMRLLHETDRNRSDEILQSLQEYLQSQPFMFQNASIISGQEEGLYGWVTVNYLMKNFVEKNLWNAFVRPEGAKTVGSMDLGGASTQLAFAVSDHLKGEDYLPVQLYGYSYNVYTHSYLCYGKNEAEKTLLDKVVTGSSDPSYVYNPCYAEGFNITVKASSIYNSPCTQTPANFDPDRDIFLVGAPDSAKCQELVRSLFDFQSCTADDCSFNGVQQPPVSGDYMAYAGFFYTARALLQNGTSTLDAFNASVTKFCHTHWKVLREEKHWISDRYLKTYCYAAHYVFTLLTDGYKFDKDTFQNIAFQKEVDNTSVGWSLGYMLSMSNMIPSEAKEILPISNPVFAGLIFLFSALLITTFIFLFILLIRTCY